MTAHLSGIVTDIFRPEFLGNFTKRVFWIKQPDSERYPQHWSVELWGEDCKRADEFSVGDHLRVDVEIRGRHWEKGGKEGIFNTLKCTGFRVTARLTAQHKPTQPDPTPATDPQTDLPF